MSRKWLLLLVPLVLVIAFVLWGAFPVAPQPEALAALQSDAAVSVSLDPWITFRPNGTAPTVGLVFYPGGRIDPRAYAPPAHRIAAAGYLVTIVPMPLNFAVLAPNRASSVMAAFPDVRHWAVGGHSLGGAMAATFARSHPTAAEGLLLWAAYPSSGDDLSQTALSVVSLYGTLDRAAASVAGSRHLLPPDTVYIPIPGGDHAQFGWYGPPGDSPGAGVTRAEQQAIAIDATVDLLSRLAARD